MVKDLIKDNFGAIWPVHVANFVEHLIACRAAVGDLDLLLVLAVIGDRTLSERRTDKSASHHELFNERRGLPEPEAINTRSIADYTGVPRETVRRKINELVERGWVAKNDKGHLYVTPEAASSLAPLTEHGIGYLSNMFEMLSALRPKA